MFLFVNNILHFYLQSLAGIETVKNSETQTEPEVPFRTKVKQFITDRWQYSFFILSPQNWLRRRLVAIVSTSYFDNAILFVIFFNCLVVTMERPSLAEGSGERQFIDIATTVINVIFLVEAIVKIVALGFFLGDDAYLKDVWNKLDFFLINCTTLNAVVDLFFSNMQEEAKILVYLRTLRLLRALRPLRVVNRARGLKIVVETLLLSVKPIGNILVITSAFFLIFSILGVQLFRGCFYKCQLSGTKFMTTRQKSNAHHNTHQTSEVEMETFETLIAVSNKSDCQQLGGNYEWENESYNFDNLFQALMTLFVFATFDGWIDITRAGIDCVGVDQQPVHDHSPLKVIYFIAFLLIVCFFVSFQSLFRI